jgi:hypothetical protein
MDAASIMGRCRRSSAARSGSSASSSASPSRRGAPSISAQSSSRTVRLAVADRCRRFCCQPFGKPYAEVSHGISIFDRCTAPRPQIPNADSPRLVADQDVADDEANDPLPFLDVRVSAEERSRLKKPDKVSASVEIRRDR